MIRSTEPTDGVVLQLPRAALSLNPKKDREEAARALLKGVSTHYRVTDGAEDSDRKPAVDQFIKEFKDTVKGEPGLKTKIQQAAQQAESAVQKSYTAGMNSLNNFSAIVKARMSVFQPVVAEFNKALAKRGFHLRPTPTSEESETKAVRETWLISALEQTASGDIEPPKTISSPVPTLTEGLIRMNIPKQQWETD